MTGAPTTPEPAPTAFFGVPPAGPVFPRTATFAGGRLESVGGVGVGDLAAEFGTPLYVLDRAELVGRMREHREAFGPEVEVVYAAKALCTVGVLQLAAAEGLGVDVASGGELATALRAGVPPERLVFHGNNKSLPELRDAAAARVGRVVVDSFSELARVHQAGSDRAAPIEILLRVTPGVQASTHQAVATAHDDAQFGFSVAGGQAAEVIARALELQGVALRGLHCHLGSQIREPEPYAAAAASLVAVLADAREQHGVLLEELDLGGGLAVAYTPEERAPSVDAHAAVLRRAVADACDQHGLPLPRLLVEPGRAIAGPAGVTLYEVGTIKRVPGGRTWVAVDGGMSDNPRPALYGASYTAAAAGPARPGDEQLEPMTVVGKHCESGDVLVRDVALPSGLVEGDHLAVPVTGAYAHSMASTYNRMPRAAMVLVGDGRADPLVRRETVEELLARDVAL